MISRLWSIKSTVQQYKDSTSTSVSRDNRHAESVSRVSRKGEEFGELGLGIDIEADPLGVVLALRDTVVHSFVMVIACML